MTETAAFTPGETLILYRLRGLSRETVVRALAHVWDDGSHLLAFEVQVLRGELFKVLSVVVDPPGRDVPLELAMATPTVQLPRLFEPDATFMIGEPWKPTAPH